MPMVRIIQPITFEAGGGMLIFRIIQPINVEAGVHADG